MGKCKYCGLEAGLLRRSHSQCEDKHRQGLAELQAELRAYFTGRSGMQLLLNKVYRVQHDLFVTSDEVAECCSRALAAYSDDIRLPITKTHLQTVDVFLNNIGISRSRLNADGAVDRLAMRLYQGVLAGYFAEHTPMTKVQQRTQVVDRLLPLGADRRQEAGLNVLSKASRHILSGGLISDRDQQLIDEFTRALNLPIHNLPSSYDGADIERINQASILRQLQKGQVPPAYPTTLPILLGSGEYVIWTYPNVTMLLEKISREWVGRHRGASIRIVKGLYYRTGGSRGHAVERSSMEKQGVGTLVLTNVNVIFYSSTRSHKVPYKKLLSVVPYSDGIELQLEGPKALRHVFQGFDSWFMVNLISALHH